MRDKHIEEMYKDVYEAINHNSVIDITHGGYMGIDTEGLTRELYDDGYRLASDVATEIFEEIEKQIAFSRMYMFLNSGVKAIVNALDELKKKYGESEDTE